MRQYTILLTGATSGIGKETAKIFVKDNHHLILGNRNPEKAQQLKQELLEINPDANLDFYHLDLVSFQSIHDFVKEVKEQHSKIDILINNAGVLSRKRRFTEEGFEITLGVNHLGTMLLTNSLLETYNQEWPKKVIMVSSIGSYWGSLRTKETLFTKKRNTFQNYFDSKLANLAYARFLQETQPNLTVKAADPGVVYSHIFKWHTGFGRFLERIQRKVMKSPTEGTVPIIELIDPLHDETKRLLFNGKKYRNLPKRIRNIEIVNDFIQFSQDTIDKYSAK